MTILLTDAERELALHYETVQGKFPVLNETEREQRWHRKVHIPSLISSITQLNAGRQMQCRECGTRNVGRRRNGTPRSWWVDVSARRVLCYTCRRNQAGRFVRYVPPRGWGFAYVSGTVSYLMQTTDFDDLWVSRQGNAFMILNVNNGGRFLTADHSRHEVCFRTLPEARNFANEYGKDRTVENLRRLLRADTRCLSFYNGHRCRLTPNHPGQHRTWSRSEPDFRWY